MDKNSIKSSSSCLLPPFPAEGDKEADDEEEEEEEEEVDDVELSEILI